MSRRPKDKPIRVRDNGTVVNIATDQKSVEAAIVSYIDLDFDPKEGEIYYDQTPRLFGKTLKNKRLAQLLANVVPRRWVDYSVRHLGVEIATVDRLPYVRHPRRLVCAANVYVFQVNGETQTRMVIGARHMDHLMRPHISEIYRIADNRGELYPKQGFIDQHGEFLSRTFAWDLARCSGQIFHDGDWPEGKLYSENLY